ncbi:MAG: glycine zipper 2TM domain-containing protein [Rickettsiales bacterium]|nr:glycine zipper 2TM domain-containing protein [Rickettsiales bacterium]
MPKPIHKTLVAITASVLATSILISCETKQQTGGLLGAAAGAAIGSQFGKGSGRAVGAGIGALIGGLAGSQIGKYMDEKDKMKMQLATQRSLEKSRTGKTSTWRNPDSGHSGTVTPTKTFQSNGRYCREFQQTITVGGKTEKGYGTACRQPDGSWQIVG